MDMAAQMVSMDTMDEMDAKVPPGSRPQVMTDLIEQVDLIDQIVLIVSIVFTIRIVLTRG